MYTHPLDEESKKKLKQMDQEVEKFKRTAGKNIIDSDPHHVPGFNRKSKGNFERT